MGVGDGVSDGVTPAGRLRLGASVDLGVTVDPRADGILPQPASRIAKKPAMIRLVFMINLIMEKS